MVVRTEPKYSISRGELQDPSRLNHKAKANGRSESYNNESQSPINTTSDLNLSPFKHISCSHTLQEALLLNSTILPIVPILFPSLLPLLLSTPRPPNSPPLLPPLPQPF
ncbi:hypothetical protein DL98DRAFT_232607 [Cadophora sp. DSE1049]|nr:hypothetical protein DL98DRAFT_232607 [Cadophora sp. DSE1049]